MSFKKFSESQCALSKEEPDDKTKSAPAADVSAAQPGSKEDKAAPVQKS